MLTQIHFIWSSGAAIFMAQPIHFSQGKSKEGSEIDPMKFPIIARDKTNWDNFGHGWTRRNELVKT